MLVDLFTEVNLLSLAGLAVSYFAFYISLPTDKGVGQKTEQEFRSAQRH